VLGGNVFRASVGTEGGERGKNENLSRQFTSLGEKKSAHWQAEVADQIRGASLLRAYGSLGLPLAGQEVRASGRGRRPSLLFTSDVHRVDGNHRRSHLREIRARYRIARLRLGLTHVDRVNKSVPFVSPTNAPAISGSRSC